MTSHQTVHRRRNAEPEPAVFREPDATRVGESARSPEAARAVPVATALAASHTFSGIAILAPDQPVSLETDMGTEGPSLAPQESAQQVGPLPTAPVWRTVLPHLDAPLTPPVGVPLGDGEHAGIALETKRSTEKERPDGAKAPPLLSHLSGLVAERPAPEAPRSHSAAHAAPGPSPLQSSLVDRLARPPAGPLPPTLGGSLASPLPVGEPLSSGQAFPKGAATPGEASAATGAAPTSLPGGWVHRFALAGPRVQGAPGVPGSPGDDPDHKSITQGAIAAGIQPSRQPGAAAKPESKDRSPERNDAEQDGVGEPGQAAAIVGPEGGPLAPSVAARIDAARSGGAPLDPIARMPMEQAFATSFAHVRIHADGGADALNRHVSALAFTTGSDIFFSHGAYQPHTATGQQLLAHELTHVVQQGDAREAGPLTVGPAGDSYEQEAEAASTGLATSGAHPTLSRRLQRASTDGTGVQEKLRQHVESAIRQERQGTAAGVGPAQIGGVSPSPTAPSGKGADGGAPATGAGAGRPPGGADASKTKSVAQNVDRTELGKKKGEVAGLVHPSANHHAEHQSRAAQAASAVHQQAATPSKHLAKGSGHGHTVPAKHAAAGEASAAAGRAAGLAQQALALAQAQAAPTVQPQVAPPAPVAPVDAAHQPLPTNPALDAATAGLVRRAQYLREQGQAVRLRAAHGRRQAHTIQGNIHTVQKGIGQAEAGLHTSQDHLEVRRATLQQAQQALGVSEQKAAAVAAQAPEYVDKASQGKQRTGPMASGARDLAGQNAAHTPSDSEAAGHAQQQGQQLNKVGSDAGSVDDAMTQTQTRAQGLGQEAAQATATNAATHGKIEATEGTLTATETRLGQLRAHTSQARARLVELAGGPAHLEAGAQELDERGQALVEASAAIESQLHQVQTNYQQGMSSVPPVRLRQPSGAAGAQRSIQRLVQRAPQDYGYADRVQVGQGLPSWLTGLDPPSVEARQEAARQQEERRRAQLAEISQRSQGDFSKLSAADKAGIALRLTGENLFSSVKKVDWPNMAESFAQGLIDPRVSLHGIVSGLSMIVSGAANLLSAEQWKRDPLGNLLKSAADIATGLTIVLGSITGLALAITVIMAALELLTLGVATPIAVPVIAFCSTVMATVGPWAITSAAVALELQGLVLIKNLIDAASASTAEELETQSDKLTEDTKNAGQMAMQVGMAALGEGAEGENMPEPPPGDIPPPPDAPPVPDSVPNAPPPATPEVPAPATPEAPASSTPKVPPASAPPGAPSPPTAYEPHPFEFDPSSPSGLKPVTPAPAEFPLLEPPGAGHPPSGLEPDTPAAAPAPETPSTPKAATPEAATEPQGPKPPEQEPEGPKPPEQESQKPPDSTQNQNGGYGVRAGPVPGDVAEIGDKIPGATPGPDIKIGGKVKPSLTIDGETYIGGEPFKNLSEGLPTKTPDGTPITYTEYDVNPYTKGVNRGAERMLIGSDGNRYYTSDHYTTFFPF